MAGHRIINQLHLACSVNDVREWMGNVYFQNGYAYATDSYIAIRTPLSELFFGSDLPQDGTMLTASQFRLCCNEDMIVTPEGVYLFDYKCVVPFQKSNDILKRNAAGKTIIDNLDDLFDANNERVPITEIGMSVKLINKIYKILKDDNMRLHFNGPQKSITLTDKYGRTVGLIMPVVVYDND